ncbi:MAG: DUF6596 domain-containing protein, partial [Bacteroidota bacterium]
TIINDDLCLEALVMVKSLWEKFQRSSSRNLLALFSFHLARIPAKVKQGKLVAFFEQDRSSWNQEFIKLGFHYMQQPDTLNKYYLEALLTSKHMTSPGINTKHWEEIIQLYQLLLQVSDSPITKLNLCYCLSKAHRLEEAKVLLQKVEKELPKAHIYLSLVKANLFKDGQNAEKLINEALQGIQQKIRREYILENMLADF